MILGASILQVPAILEAKKMGLTVIAVDMNPDAIGFDMADKKIVISTIDIEGVLKIAREEKIDGIMTLASDMPMRTVATVAKELGLVGIDVQTAINATDKSIMRECLKDKCVPIPKFYKVASFEEYKNVVKLFKESFIVKPADSSGSRGIFLIEDLLDENIINHAYEYSKQFSRNGIVLVEEFMTGSEVSVETLSVNGKCEVIQITDKLTTGAPYFVEMGHSQPSRHSLEVIEKIKEVAILAVNAIGIKDGPSHTEIMVTKDGPKIVELGARLGGDCITTHLVPLSTGVNMVRNCILIALGEKPDLEIKFSRGSAIRYFNSKKGTLKEIKNIDKAKLIDGIKEISVVKSVGETITDINSSTARIGFVIADGENKDIAIDICDKAIKEIEVVIE
ncbi:MAG: ATP-grasp domain-containing protein [Clostridiales bacterium]|nr:ATP-grasp domain-containing protein [Clostridiales bacterium]